jgi:hypothetical protein
MSHISDGLATDILKGKMASQRVSYAELSRRLEEIGVKGTAGSLRSKVSRGTFTADFFLQCLLVMDIKTIRLDES